MILLIILSKLRTSSDDLLDDLDAILMSELDIF
jgi:hypothetical protein